MHGRQGTPYGHLRHAIYLGKRAQDVLHKIIRANGDWDGYGDRF